jgi:hypothetical protein
MNLDELRNSTARQNPDPIEEEEVFTFDDVQEERHILGMTAVERMFLSIFLFMNVVVLGLALLLATHRLVL